MVAMTVEADGTGALYPVAYVRKAGMISEVMLPVDPLLQFATPEHRAALAASLDGFPGIAALAAG